MPESSTTTPIKVWYQPLPGSSPSKWPLVDIRLQHKDIHLPQPLSALIDSGANLSLLHPQVAEVFGFNKQNLQFTSGGKSVSGAYKSAIIPHPMSVSIYGYVFPVTFSVIDNPDLAFACILRQDSIFKWARLDFQGFKTFLKLSSDWT